MKDQIRKSGKYPMQLELDQLNLHIRQLFHHFHQIYQNNSLRDALFIVPEC